MIKYYINVSSAVLTVVLLFQHNDTNVTAHLALQWSRICDSDVHVTTLVLGRQ